MSDENDIETNDDVDASYDEGDSYEASAYSSSDDLSSAEAAARNNIRVQLQSDVEAFLASGGKIKEIAPNVVADPPKKPQSNYGGQPI